VTVAIWLLFLVPLGLALAAQGLLRWVFRRYRTVPNHEGVTGAEVARALLDAHGLQDVRLELAPGFLSDHYDGEARALRLSEVVARERSVAALGIAAHEVSHAYQDAEGSRAYRARHSIGEQLAQIAPWSGLFLIGGFWFGVPLLVALSLVFVAGLCCSRSRRCQSRSERAAARSCCCERRGSQTPARGAASAGFSPPRR
jgi:uncharacterized protein